MKKSNSGAYFTKSAGVLEQCSKPAEAPVNRTDNNFQKSSQFHTVKKSKKLVKAMEDYVKRHLDDISGRSIKFNEHFKHSKLKFSQR